MKKNSSLIPLATLLLFIAGCRDFRPPSTPERAGFTPTPISSLAQAATPQPPMETSVSGTLTDPAILSLYSDIGGLTYKQRLESTNNMFLTNYNFASEIYLIPDSLNKWISYIDGFVGTPFPQFINNKLYNLEIVLNNRYSGQVFIITQAPIPPPKTLGDLAGYATTTDDRLLGVLDFPPFKDASGKAFSDSDKDALVNDLIIRALGPMRLDINPNHSIDPVTLSDSLRRLSAGIAQAAVIGEHGGSYEDYLNSVNGANKLTGGSVWPISNVKFGQIPRVPIARIVKVN